MPEPTARLATAGGGGWRDRAPLLVAAAIWAGLLVALDRAGHAPTFGFGPLPRARWYAIQAVLVAPCLLAMHAGGVALGARVARVDPSAIRRGLAAAFGWPLALLHLVPEAVVYGTAGFAALGRSARITLPLATLAAIATATLVLRAAPPASPARTPSRGRALAAAAVAILLPWAAAGPILR